MTTPDGRGARPADLTKFAWLSIAAALLTIALKTAAWWLTGSVGLLSDAIESLVNLAAALGALVALRVAARPADHSHPYGHGKAEYFSAGAEGIMIVVAATAIIITAIQRLINPMSIENVGIGLGVSVLASIVNGAVAAVLLRAGRAHRSSALVADGKHLLTDVWTSAGVLVGVALVALTGWERLDPIVALLVGLNIIITGWRIITDSGGGLMDSTWPREDNERFVRLVRSYASGEVEVHGLRTRQAGRVRFAELHLLVPGDWSVRAGHDLAHAIEEAVHAEFPGADLMCHLEPLEDPRAHGDYAVDVSDVVTGPDPSPDAGVPPGPGKGGGR